MEVTVRFFAGCREAVKQDEATLSLPDGATLADLQVALAETYPAIAHYAQRVRYSVNWEYAAPDTTLDDGDEVAMIPPVAGGSDRSRAWVTEDVVSEDDVRPLACPEAIRRLAAKILVRAARSAVRAGLGPSHVGDAMSVGTEVGAELGRHFLPL